MSDHGEKSDNEIIADDDMTDCKLVGCWPWVRVTVAWLPLALVAATDSSCVGINVVYHVWPLIIDVP